MPKVTYLKHVSDSNVKLVLGRIARGLGRSLTVHSGDRTEIVKGSSSKSLHLKKRAADFHIQGLTDEKGFELIKAKFNELFDAEEAYEVIYHGPHTATGGEHLHLGRYGEERKGYVNFKTEGLSPKTKGNYADKGSETKTFTNVNKTRIPETVISGVTVEKSVLSPTLGVFQSVGIGGNNNPDDVRLIQTLINEALPRLIAANIPFERFRPLVADGNCGPMTKKAIHIFQRDVIQLDDPDGRVDRGGITIRSLYVAAFGTVEKVVPRIRSVRTHLTTNVDGNGSWNGVLAWGSHPKVTPAFREKTIQICNELGIKDPGWLMTVMAFETGRTFSPAKKNAAGSSGTGLIQFMKETIDGRTVNGKQVGGIGEKLNITHADLPTMSAVRQLDVVKSYFQQFGTKAANAKDVDDLYFLVLLPSAYGRPDEAVMFEKGTKSYRQNKGLDKDKDGNVTVQETAVKIRKMLREGLDKYPFPRR